MVDIGLTCGLVLTIILLIGYITKQFLKTKENVFDIQEKLLCSTYSANADKKRPVEDQTEMFINYYSLGCRFTGFMGPSKDCYYNPDIAVQTAVNAGCRVFVLEIDYLTNGCDTNKYFPTLVIRDKNGKRVLHRDAASQMCNSEQYSNIRETCKAIKTYVYGSSCQNKTDPVVLVLYFVRQPPGDYKSITVLNYFSNVAKMIAPLSEYFLKNEATGTYYRQSNESKLLQNTISNYNNKVLVFSNADTSGFRENATYEASEDLDHIVNLRLTYKNTPLGITSNRTSTMGYLDTVDTYMTIPDNRSSDTLRDTKHRWTICFSSDPLQSVPEQTYKKVTETYGVNCIPIILWDIPTNNYMFAKKPLFDTYSYTLKPESLRLRKPPTIEAGTPGPTTNANKGRLRHLHLMT